VSTMWRAEEGKTTDPPNCIVLFLQRTNPTTHTTTLLGSNELSGFKGSVVCGRRWGVTTGGSREVPYRGLRFKFKFKSPWAGHCCHVAEAGVRQPERFARMRSPSQKLVAKPLPLSKNVINALFPVQFSRGFAISNFIKPGTRTGPYRELALTWYPPFLSYYRVFPTTVLIL
jgi:hypothetical protein